MAAMSRSPADAISRAIERSQQLLFPFNANKWFALGFTVLLAQCGESGGGMSMPNFPSSPGRGPSGGSSGLGGGAFGEFQKGIHDAVAAMGSDLPLYVTLAIAAVVLSIGLWITVVWLSSRAKLMFVESVIWDRVDISAQWARAGDLGMSLCKFRLALGGGSFVLILGAMAAGVALALPDFKINEFFGPRAMLGYATMGGAFFLIGLPVLITFALLDDFVVPLMVVRNARVREAWAMCRDEVLSGNIGGIFVFYLLRMVLSFFIAMAVMVLTCNTCCMTALPYIGTVITLPIWVFTRAYPLYYLEVLGISIFPAPEPSWGQYDAWRFPR
jgi:hypothetical protein